MEDSISTRSRPARLSSQGTPCLGNPTLGPYEILSPLGSGGQGEVYKARDTRLDRTVAIKVLPEHVASDPDLKQRFEREAKTISSLNHPHICTLYDIGSQDGIDFLVMEYLEGETLAQRLQKGALPLDQALTVAIEIADALDKAHRQGITHRDLKPGNIMLTKSGAKLLDFGLAKLKPGHDAPVGVSAPTVSAGLTGEGAILGTLQYMAPEQLEGKEADHRTDIYTEGALVARPFDAESEAFVGDPTLVTADVSYAAASIQASFRVSGDASVIIVRPAGGEEAQLTWFRRDGEVVGSVGPVGRPMHPRISPNGEAVLFQAPDPQTGNRDVWHTELARGITTSLTTHIANDWYPVWSPDGSQILFTSDREPGGVYLKSSFDPGADETRILERGAPQDWSRDGRWISVNRGQDQELWVASVSGAQEAFVFLDTPAWEANGRFSPDGKWLAYASNETGQWEVHVRPFDGRSAGRQGRIQISDAGGGFPVWGPVSGGIGDCTRAARPGRAGGTPSMTVFEAARLSEAARPL